MRLSRGSGATRGDHYALFRQWIEQHQPEPEDEAAGQALTDDSYYEHMVAYGKELEALIEEVWEEAYVRG